MRWRQPADRRAVEAVVATFCEPSETLGEVLSRVSHHSWSRSCQWLDASGMGLYFVRQIEALGLEAALPAPTLRRLQQNLADNRKQSGTMFEEFADLNRRFNEAGLSYCALKGFSLIPDACPESALRCQMDLDFLVDSKDLARYSELLRQKGYLLAAAKADVWEFKAGSSRLVDISEHYKPKQQRCIELHFTANSPTTGSPTRDGRLDELITRTLNGVSFPALSDVEQMAGQALHLLSHLRSPSTRLSWLLEFKRNICAHREQPEFWNELRRKLQHNLKAQMALGIATSLAAKVFGYGPPSQFAWTLNQVSPAMLLWVDQYGRRALLADSPGTKLHLLLEGLLPWDGNHFQKKRINFLPQIRLQQIVFPEPTDSWMKRLGGKYYDLRYAVFRVRFQLVHTSLYLMELCRWKMRLRSLHSKTTGACP